LRLESWENIRNLNELVKFILSYLIYNDGIVVVISFAAIYGSARFGMSGQQLIKYFIIMQPSSMVGAFVFGYILDKIGAKKTILISLLIWIIVVLGAFFCTTIQQYYIIGIIAGLAIGSSQSSSRAMLALLTPSDKTAEFFGFYSFSGRMASIIGPLVYGEIARITNDQRYSILSLIVFFVIGAIVLSTVNEKKGIQQAENW